MRFSELINFVEVGAPLKLENLVGMLQVSSTPCSALMTLERVRSDSLKCLSQKASSGPCMWAWVQVPLLTPCCNILH